MQTIFKPTYNVRLGFQIILLSEDLKFLHNIFFGFGFVYIFKILLLLKKH